ncbi:MAG: hypothetical protein HY538_05025 [Deltaproteobacteria bacterium]|nr:hypothetical protein [Deltaproteobacteria bacterium]
MIRRHHYLMVLLVATFLFGCGDEDPPPQVAEDPAATPAAPAETDNPKVAAVPEGIPDLLNREDILDSPGEGEVSVSDVKDVIDSISVVNFSPSVPPRNGNEGEDPEEADPEEDPEEEPREIPITQSFAVGVVSFVPGSNAGFGSDEFPEIVLGSPQGGGDGAGSTDVLSLGDEGEIVLDFGDQVIVDKEGIDFTVFENPFFAGGNPDSIFVEAGIVSVSQDGVIWCAFPFDLDPTLSITNPARYQGFAGVQPVYADESGDPNPFDPSVSGGDSFDLASIGLSWARYLRITDPGFQKTADADGDLIEDAGDHVMGPGQGGFDLDAIAALYVSPLAFFIGSEITKCPGDD